jgi:hypothetical protein
MESIIKNHQKAAMHNAEAAKYHHEAAKHHEAGNHDKAHHSTIKAHGHTAIARETEEEIIKHHAEN